MPAQAAAAVQAETRNIGVSGNCWKALVEVSDALSEARLAAGAEAVKEGLR